MPCDTRLREGQTQQQRAEQTKQALKRLEAALTLNQVRVRIGPNGAVAFDGWRDRDDVSDVCAIRALQAQNSWALKQAIARAEAQQGRKVNPAAIASGVHSHDSGKTWSPGH